MEYISLIISIISCVIVVLTFFNNKGKDASKSVQELAYKQGQTDQLFKNIMEKLQKIENKLDNFDNEIDKRIEIALNHHIKELHQK